MEGRVIDAETWEEGEYMQGGNQLGSYTWYDMMELRMSRIGKTLIDKNPDRTAQPPDQPFTTPEGA